MFDINAYNELKNKINNLLNKDEPILNTEIESLDKFITEENLIEHPLSLLEVEELKNCICRHNIEFAKKYSLYVINFVENSTKEEIKKCAVDGYIFVGYKGTSATLAKGFLECVDYNKYNPSKTVTGYSFGPGLSTTPHRDTAKDLNERDI